jgi:hypothetical protein
MTNSGALEIRNKKHLLDELKQRSSKHYVYLLRLPDNLPAYGSTGTPFYVGVGQKVRMFEHEKAARSSDQSSPKLDTIRKIKASRRDVIYTIDSWHDTERGAFLREADLINQIGLVADGSGTLTNTQTYAAPQQINGIEVSKYLVRQTAAGSVEAMPTDFPYRSIQLKAGPRKPTNPTSVFGIIFDTLAKNPGITGEQLYKLLMQIDWSVCKKTKYVSDGKVCGTWVCDYIKGGFYTKNLHIEIYQP